MNNIEIPTAQVKAALLSAAMASIGDEVQLATAAQAQIQQLIDSLYPLMVAQTQAIITATDPTVAKGYLAILSGVVQTKIAELSLAALATQKQQIARGFQTALAVLGVVLKAAKIAAA